MTTPATDGFPVANGRQLGRAALGLLRSAPWMFTLTIGFGVLAAALSLAPPWLAGRVVDAIARGTTLAEIDRYGAMLVGLAVVQLLVSRFSVLATARLGQKVSQRLRRSIIDRVLELPARVVDRADTGDLLVRTTRDTSAVTGIFSGAAPEMLIAMVQILLTVTLVMALSPLLAVVAVLGMLGIPLVTRWYLRRAPSAYLAEADGHARVAESLSGTTVGARTVELYGLQDRRRCDMDARLAQARTSQATTLRLRSVFFPVLDSSYVVALALVLLAGAWLYGGGGIALGALVAVLLYVRQLSGPMDTVLLWLESLQSAIASYARVEGLARAEIATPPVTTEVPRSAGVEVSDVSFAYGDEPDVLRHVDLTITPGENLVIVGASGAGKSTLARLLVGIEAHTSGSVALGGVEASHLAVEVRRSQVALVTQEQHLFRDTIRTNLLLARPDASDRELLAAMAAVRAEWWDTRPGGLDAPVVHGEELTGAQAQHIALARVLLADPRTVVLDEATSQMSPGAASAVERSLRAVLRGRTVITIVHRLSTARGADRILVLDEGQVVEVGTHEELLGRGGHYARLWRAWEGDVTT